MKAAIELEQFLNRKAEHPCGYCPKRARQPRVSRCREIHYMKSTGYTQSRVNEMAIWTKPLARRTLARV